MDAETIKRLADAILAVSDNSVRNWVFPAALILFSALGAYVGGYLKLKAENLATKEDFVGIKSRIAETTRTIENIRTDISLKDWTWREKNALRRSKLEELIERSCDVLDWVSEAHQSILFRKREPITRSPIDAMQMRAVLYFPELQDAVNEFSKAVMASMQHIYETQREMLGIDAAQQNEILRQSSEKWGRLYAEMKTTQHALHREGRTLMEIILDGPTGASQSSP